MSLLLLSPELVEATQDAILNSGELPGRARDKSLESALARVENRIAYGMIADAFDLAAAYAMAIARGHCFNDGNKRTAHQAMDVCLDLNGFEIAWDAEEVGQMVIRCAQGELEDHNLADWLRERTQ
jgi:death-on-curing protein